MTRCLTSAAIPSALIATVALAPAACDSDKRSGRGTTPSASQSAVAGPSASQSAVAGPSAASSAKTNRRKWFVPTGPRLAIVPGSGIGPIRFGGSRDTVERHMALRCDETTPTFCRYVTRAIDFHFVNGELEEIVVHRKGRPAGEDLAGEPREFGIFNGALPPHNLVPGMLMSAVVQELPKPARIERIENDDRGFGTVSIHHYPGYRLEFDEVGERGTLLGAVVVTRK